MTKFSGITPNSAPALLDYLLGVTSGNVDDRKTIQNVLKLLVGANGILGGQIQSYTNTQTNGGTGYYINLGGIKLCWGQTGNASIGTSTGVGVSLPTSFFTTVQTANLYMAASSTGDAMVRQTAAATTSLMSGWFTSGSTASAALGWLVIGT